MSVNKQLWLLAGGNGVGKSTFYRTRLAPLGLPFINADLIAKELFPEAPEANSYVSARIATEMRNKLLTEGRSFCFETVFSHPSKIDFIARAKAFGYETILIFIHLTAPETVPKTASHTTPQPTPHITSFASLHKARIAQRVQQGGHNVPDDKVENRIPRTLNNIKVAIPLCDHVRLLDNSSATDPFQVVATVRQGHIDYQQEPAPVWVQQLLNES